VTASFVMLCDSIFIMLRLYHAALQHAAYTSLTHCSN
jgi:hypothetical protein